MRLNLVNTNKLCMSLGSIARIQRQKVFASLLSLRWSIIERYSNVRSQDVCTEPGEDRDYTDP